jgi:hypothetical protein
MICHMTFHKVRACVCHEHRPECNCETPAVAASPLALWAPTVEQLRFLRLHSPAGSVTRWQWHFMDTQLRAYTDAGETATIWRDALQELVDQGLMRWGHGQQVCLTAAGLQCV